MGLHGLLQGYLFTGSFIKKHNVNNVCWKFKETWDSFWKKFPIQTRTDQPQNILGPRMVRGHTLANSDVHTRMNETHNSNATPSGGFASEVHCRWDECHLYVAFEDCEI
jgi:hypothetical protein